MTKTDAMEPEYAAAMREHVERLAEELGELRRLAADGTPLPPLLYRAGERNLLLLTEAVHRYCQAEAQSQEIGGSK